MPKKRALLIGNETYDDPAFSRLVVPSSDVRGLSSVLEDAEGAAFDVVTPVENQPRGVVAEEMEAFLVDAEADDLLLVYFSGHGLRSATDGSLYLALKDTKRDRLRATGISASFVRDLMDGSSCRRQLLILDCCYSGAFTAGMKAGSPVGEAVDTRGAFAGGLGRVVLSASDETQYAWEGDSLIGEGQNSLYTRYLIEGLATGRADRDQDGLITVDELHEYAYDQVRRVSKKQNPQMHVLKAEGRMVIASVPERLQRAAALDPQIQQAMVNPFTDVRLGAVSSLERLLRGGHSGLARAAEMALRQLIEDDSRKVAAAATAALGGERAQGAAAPGAGRAVEVQRRSGPRPEEIMLRGAERSTKALRATLGPRARNVVINRAGSEAVITTDSSVIVRESELSDSLEKVGAQLIRRVVTRMAASVQDGAATAAVLACSLLRAGLSVPEGSQRSELAGGIQRASAPLLERLKAMAATPGPNATGPVATFAAGGDERIGNLIVDAMKKVGRDGPIVVEETHSVGVDLNVVEGMQIDRGYLSPQFVTDADRVECVLQDAYVLLYEGRINGLQPMLPILEQAARAGKPLFLVAEELDQEALATLVVNKLRGTLASCAIRAPGFGQRRTAMLDDIAVATGGVAIHDSAPGVLEAVKLESLGRAKRIIATLDQTTIVDGAGEANAIERRVRQLRKQIDETTSDYDREKLQERLAKIAGGVAVIGAGGATEAQSKATKAAIEKALDIFRMGLGDGCVPGGGVALVRAVRALDESKISARDAPGASALEAACDAPFRDIAASAGEDPERALRKLLETRDPDYGFDAAKGEWKNLRAAGIVDPVKVVAAAVETAVAESVAFLNSETVVFE